MSTGKQIRFWGYNLLCTVGTAAAAALVILVLQIMGDSGVSSVSDVQEKVLTIYPHSLFSIGVLVISIVTVTYFQVYVPVLVSMNCTRRRAVLGVIAVTALEIAAITVAACSLWYFVPGGLLWEAGWKLVVLLFGLAMAVVSVFLVVGVAIARWGKRGVILATIVYMVLGGACGAYFVLGIRDFDAAWAKSGLQALLGNSIYVFAGGCLLYLASGVFAVAATRRIEVRV